jgi:uncharacterized Zn-finger protein
MIPIPKWGAAPFLACCRCGHRFTLHSVASGKPGVVVCPNCGESNYTVAERSRLAQVSMVVGLALLGIWLISLIVG